MKNGIKILAMLSIGLLLTSCVDEKKLKAEKASNDYVRLVDSVTALKEADAIANWDTINASLEYKLNQAKLELDKLEDKSSLDSITNNATTRYELFKISINEDVLENKAQNEVLFKGRALFGADYLADDMKFAWVNKDNILSVYDQFVSTVQKNKDSYSREDWDEIKLMYEALDTRKNTVEKNGLSSSDNSKIASLKFKFAPMYKLNRMGAKSEENAEAKK